jgi:hypothetical protein
MVRSLSTPMLENFDTLPSFYRNPYPQAFGNASAPVSPHEWMTGTPYSEDSGYVSVYDRDEFGFSAEFGYKEDGWAARRTVEFRESRDRNEDKGNIFIEQCHSRHCFFGCGGRHPPTTCRFGENDNFNRDWKYDLEGVQHWRVDFERERMLARPYDRDIGRPNGFLMYVSSLFTFIKCSSNPSLESNVLDYHERRASLPSSPTQSIHPRHRRLSEPFNAPAHSRTIRRFADNGIHRGPVTEEEKATMRLKDQPKPILFKTELCRSWEEKGSCRYGYIFLYTTNVPGTNVNLPILQ